jgi:peptidoglycan/xylan/chitin deacetylase (PgdA/CDA1 family)
VNPSRRDIVRAAALAALAACTRRAPRTAPPPAASTTPPSAPSASGVPAPPSTTLSPPAGEAAYVRSGPSDVPAVALTFHGSGDVALAHRLLDEAERAGARITVFAVGQWLAANPAIATRLRAGGHELANHTYTHPSLGRLSAASVRTEIERCDDVVRAANGGAVAWFRPSAMAVPTLLVRRAAAVTGHRTVVGYDVDSRDFTDPGARAIHDNVLRGVRNGSIVSLHLGHPGTVDALPGLLAALHDKGLRCVTTSGLLRGAAAP